MRLAETNNEIIVLMGFSGAGKDTLAKELAERQGYNFVVSCSTRPMRDGESQGNPYNFVTKEELDKVEIVEKRAYETYNEKGEPDVWYYAVPKSAIEDHQKYVVVLDWDGYKNFKKVYGDRIIPIFLALDEKERMQRAIKRGGFNQIEWDRRAKDDRKIFQTVEKEISEECIIIRSTSIPHSIAQLRRAFRRDRGR